LDFVISIDKQSLARYLCITVAVLKKFLGEGKPNLHIIVELARYLSHTSVFLKKKFHKKIDAKKYLPYS